jgi:potassium efflux system protein
MAISLHEIGSRLFLLLCLAAFAVPQAYGQGSTSAVTKQEEAAEMLETIERNIRETQEEVHLAEERLEQLRASLGVVREVLEIGLSDEEAGALLRESRQRAPDAGATRRALLQRERELSLAKLERIRLMESLRLEEDTAESARLEQVLERQEEWVAVLDKARAIESEIAVDATALTDLLDSRLLWLPSASPIGRVWLAEVAAGVHWITNPHAWQHVLRDMATRGAQRPVLPLVFLLIIVGLLVMRGRAQRSFVVIAERTNKHASDSFLLTLKALVCTLVLILPIPVLLLGLSSLLLSPTHDGFTRSFGQGLLAAGMVYLLLDFFRVMCRSNGLAAAHFTWNEQARQTLLRNLFWLLPICVAGAFVVVICDTSASEVHKQGLGRLGFMLATFAVAIFLARVLRPGQGVLSQIMFRNWLWRTRRLWYGCIVALPSVLVIAAAAGYYYTATQLQNRFFASGIILLMGMLIYGLLGRWLMVTHRRAAIRQARRKLSEQREARLREGDQLQASVASGEAVPEIEPEQIDVKEISRQTLALVRILVVVFVLTALWGVWNKLFPALNILQQITILDGQGGQPALTMWSIALALLAAGISVAAARNLPAVVELTILQRFPIDRGTRYAATILIRYAVLAVSIIVISHLLNIDWSKAQWVVAALGVGLGFGLQEIVANFVSGLIILFERPVRVGDAVTVGEISGTVSKLQIRATTITDWDNREVLVPNKNFITERVINWTLSDPITRLLIPVGIAYGSDVAEAHRIMSEAVASVPAVLEEPAPSVLFLGFGDSSLNFEVRAFVPELSKRLPTMHELHAAIDEALRKANITIPFPQRDIHIKR